MDKSPILFLDYCGTSPTSTRTFYHASTPATCLWTIAELYLLTQVCNFVYKRVRSLSGALVYTRFKRIRLLQWLNISDYNITTFVFILLFLADQSAPSQRVRKNMLECAVKWKLKKIGHIVVWQISIGLCSKKFHFYHVPGAHTDTVVFFFSASSNFWVRGEPMGSV